jgi:hypothetical protein
MVSLSLRSIGDSASPQERAQARKEIAWVMLNSVVLGGIMGGLPTAALLKLYGLFFGGDEDEPRDVQGELEAYLATKPGGQLALRGIAGTIGGDVSRRIGLADVFGLGGGAPASLHGDSYADWLAVQGLGPFWSVARGWFEGYDKITREGKVYEGMSYMVPKAVRDAMRAWELVARDGAKTTSGKVVVPSEEADLVDVTLLAIGINPTKLASAFAKERAVRNIGVKLSERRAELIRKYVDAYETGDPELVEEQLDEIAAFNRKQPGAAVTKSDVRSASTTAFKKLHGISTDREAYISQQIGFE